MLTTAFCLTTIQLNSLTALTTLFYFINITAEISDCANYTVLLHYYWNEISGYADYAAFFHY